MHNDLTNLIIKMKMLEDTTVEEVVAIIEETPVHPLLQAMRELREDGTVDSVDANTIYRTVQSAHHTPEDFEEGDIGDRIYWFDDYKLTSLPIADLNLNEYYVDEDRVDDYVERIQYSPNTMPPIVYDPIAKSIIDGIHRAAAYSKLGHATIPAYSGLTKSESYGEREEIDETVEEPIIEASPDTLEGSFTPDLVESKEWLCEKLAKGLKGKNAGTIYVLGSWYGNIGIFLEQAGIKYDKLVLIEPNEEAIERSKKLLDPLNDDGKIVFISQKAEDVVYEKPGIVINTSCNETGPVFLTKLPDNMLCLLQARNNNDNTLFPTEHEEDFVDYFPLQTVYYTGKKDLEDPEINYVRYMIIGRSGKKTTMTNEALDSSYPYESGKINGRYRFKTEDGVLYKVWFGGFHSGLQLGEPDLVEISFSATLPGGPHKTTLTGTGNSRKVFGTVVNIVQDYIKTHAPKALYFTADGDEPSRIKLYNALISQVDKALPDYYADKPLDLKLQSGRGYMLRKKTSEPFKRR